MEISFDVIGTILCFVKDKILFEVCDQNPQIINKHNYWLLRIEQEFGNIKNLPGKTPYEQYIIKKENHKYPELKIIINRWKKDITEVLDLRLLNKKLKRWPELLRGEEYKILRLNCSRNLLPYLPNLPNCIELDCEYNRLKELPVLTRCVSVHCSHNLIERMSDLPKCVILRCGFNKLKRLPKLKKCRILNCSENLIEELPELKECEVLNCFNNKLTKLPLLKKVKRGLSNFRRNKFKEDYSHRFVERLKYHSPIY